MMMRSSLKPAFTICEAVEHVSAPEETRILDLRLLRRRAAKAWKAFKLSAVSSFAYVETAGLSYATKIISDSLGLTRTVPDPNLDGLDIEIRKGEVVALVGSSGGGKSTVANLLPRFWDVTGGRITIDGVDLRDVTIESLRRQIGIVLQETTLFSGTIRENIAFGKPEATQAEIETAAKAAQAHDFIMSFPEKYDTHVGERGTTLSGGQKQRVAIARALLLNPRILILDDSTSSVDLTTEAAIQDALDVLMKGRTSFVIAQRISTVMNADKIIVLDRGEVAAIGRHAELLEDNPIYADIYNSQILAYEAEHASAKEGAL